MHITFQNAITNVHICQDDKPGTGLYGVFGIKWMMFYLGGKHRLYETKAWRMAHCAMPAASADRGKHVISTRDIRHVIRALGVRSYRDNLLIQKKQDVVPTSYPVLVLISTQCRRIFGFVTRSQKM